jgi:hypothetical protein
MAGAGACLPLRGSHLAGLADTGIGSNLTGCPLAGAGPINWGLGWLIGARKNTRSLGKKIWGYVSAAVAALARPPVGHQFPPELERAFLAVGSLKGQEISPVRSGQTGAFYCPPQVAELALFKAQLFALQFSGI